MDSHYMTFVRNPLLDHILVATGSCMLSFEASSLQHW